MHIVNYFVGFKRNMFESAVIFQSPVASQEQGPSEWLRWRGKLFWLWK